MEMAHALPTTVLARQTIATLPWIAFAQATDIVLTATALMTATATMLYFVLAPVTETACQIHATALTTTATPLCLALALATELAMTMSATALPTIAIPL